MAQVAITRTQLHRILDHFDTFDEDDIRDDYSGRGMYGRTCLAIDTYDRALLLDLGYALKALEDEIDEWDLDYDLADAFRCVYTDSMGMGGAVVYWPSIRLLDEDVD